MVGGGAAPRHRRRRRRLPRPRGDDDDVNAPSVAQPRRGGLDRRPGRADVGPPPPEEPSVDAGGFGEGVSGDENSPPSSAGRKRGRKDDDDRARRGGGGDWERDGPSTASSKMSVANATEEDTQAAELGGRRTSSDFTAEPSPSSSGSTTVSPSRIVAAAAAPPGERTGDADSETPIFAGGMSENPMLRSLPCLLALRESGLLPSSSSASRVRGSPGGPSESAAVLRGGGGRRCGGGKRELWQARVLRRPPAGDLSADGEGRRTSAMRREWRPYASRSIPFSSLRTPPAEALLALDRWGSYMVCLGSGEGRRRGDDDDNGGRCLGPRPVLALKFYGVPSPARMEAQRRHMMRRQARCRRADGQPSWPGPGFTSDASPPLLLTLPLRLPDSSREHESDNSSVLGDADLNASAAMTPVRILTSSDGAVGAAFLPPPGSLMSHLSSPATRDEDVLGTVVVFPLPSTSSALSVSCLDTGRRQQRGGRSSTGVAAAVAKSYRCANVRVGGWSAHTMRNLLWPVSLVPVTRSVSSTKFMTTWPGELGPQSKLQLCDSFLRTDHGGGYLLLNDEDDGFRMTWVVLGCSSMSEAGWTGGHSRVADAANVPPPEPHCRIVPGRSDIVTAPQDEAWEKAYSEPFTGRPLGKRRNSRGPPGDGGIEIAFEAYLNVEALLGDIVSRRRKLLAPLLLHRHSDGFSSRIMPDFYYNLISVSTDGRLATLVIVFGSQQRPAAKNTSGGVAAKEAVDDDGSATRKAPPPAAVGVFVKLDLISQRYDELEWVQHPTKSDVPFLRGWKNELATNWRMREVGAGPFCRTTDDCGDLGGGQGQDQQQQQQRRSLRNVAGVGTHESNDGEGEADDFDPDLWEEYATAAVADGPSKVASRDVSMSSLYPNCDFISNQAVTSGLPVHRIACRRAPLELIYG